MAEDVQAALTRLREICSPLAPCVEASSYGNPAFKRGKKPFAVLDHYKGQPCLWLRVDPVLRDDLLARPGWFPSPYDPRQLALCCALDQLDWTAVAPLVAQAHHLAGL